MMKSTALALVAALGLSVPAQADPTIGFGFTMAFSGGEPNAGVGLRLFSDDEQDSTVGSLGVDYMFRTRVFRPTVGIAFLDEDYYLGLDLGYDSALNLLDFGVSGGLVDTESPGRRSAPAGGDDGDDGGDALPIDGGGDLID
ncbi:hypothetical protein [Dinoroseobacter sp. S124A]|uniref:hypothetical protein n=1 Tax=Dinoroseobacter sp. S124A TaxID=3415128 RepID=UPI003C7B23B4